MMPGRLELRSQASALSVSVAPPKRPPWDVYFELAVTLGLFVVPATLAAAYIHVTGDADRGPAVAEWRFASQAIQEILLVGLFFYVLRTNGESLSRFTRPAGWRDVPRAFGLLIAAWVGYAVVMFIVWRWAPLGLHVHPPRNVGVFRNALSVPYVALLLLNPFCEELWVRAFLQTRLRDVGWPAPLVVVASASVQAAYHLYQGAVFVVAYAVAGVLATYYACTTRLWPVIGAHLVADVSAGLLYSRLG